MRERFLNYFLVSKKKLTIISNKNKKRREILGWETKWTKEGEAITLIINVMNEYWNQYEKYAMKSRNLRYCTGSITYDGGAKICEAFRTFANLHVDRIYPLRKITDAKILMEIKSWLEVRPSLLLPQEAWEKLIRHNIRKLQNPCLELAENVKNILEDITQHVEVKELETRKNLRNYLNLKVISVIEKNHQELEEMLKKEIQSERWYINFDDDNFQRKIEEFQSQKSSEK